MNDTKVGPFLAFLIVLFSIFPSQDNDTIAAIVGAVMGAVHGKAALPLRWLEGLPGRTRATDNGQIYLLLQQAKLAYWLLD